MVRIGYCIESFDNCCGQIYGYDYDSRATWVFQCRTSILFSANTCGLVQGDVGRTL
jgi:hypothetical protein